MPESIILVVDDEPQLLSLVTAYLKPEGYLADSVWCESGRVFLVEETR